jgi:hypothetical protein
MVAFRWAKERPFAERKATQQYNLLHITPARSSILPSASDFRGQAMRERPTLWMAALCTSHALGQGSRPRNDVFGDPLPTGAVARIGTTRLWHRSPAGITAVA